MTASQCTIPPVHPPDRWYFTKDQILQSPSVKKAIPPVKETSYRQHAALLIQEMGQKLKVNQLCINTAIVYMHRFYTCHSFSIFHRNKIARACIFLSAKVEEQPRRLEHVINTAHFILNTGTPSNPRVYQPLDPHGDEYKREVEELIRNETIILQTLGFEVTPDHPHTHVVRAVQQLKVLSGPSEGGPASGGGTPYLNDLARSSYFMATESLHLTTFCLQYKPNLVAAVCIHIACKWTNFEIDHPDPGRHWWELLGSEITIEQLNAIANEFLKILENTPTKLKQKMIRPPPTGSVRRDSVKRPRVEGERPEERHHPQQRSNHHGQQPGPNRDNQESRGAMERLVSDKLDALIGSTVKPKSNGSGTHKSEEKRPPSLPPHKSSPHLSQHKSSPYLQEQHRPGPLARDKSRPPSADHRVHARPPPPPAHLSRDRHEYGSRSEDERNKLAKKPRVPDPKISELNMKRLEQRMKSEQLDMRGPPGKSEFSMKQEPKSAYGVKAQKEDSPPPPPPPPPLMRAPVPHPGSAVRYNLPPPPLHKQSEHRSAG